MTIITKPLSEKKEDKLILPLVDNDQLASAPPTNEDVEAQGVRKVPFVILRAPVRRVSTTTTLCLLLTALMVVGVGILGGTYLYEQYLRSPYLRSPVFKGWCSFPYDQTNTAAYIGKPDPDIEMEKEQAEDMEKYNNFIRNVFSERFELDMENEMYEKIDVPDFKDGRVGRFVHDFNLNKTGIIDVTGKRCFVMPLNRENVLPPKSLFDLIHKMWEGYYKVNLDRIRETMRVVTPPITDTKEIGLYIATECAGLSIYKLEKFEKGVWKRSTDAEKNVKFAQFSGNGILELDIINLSELEDYEKSAAPAVF